MSFFNDVRLIFDTAAFEQAAKDAVTAYKQAGKKAVTITTAKATKALASTVSDAGLGKLGKAFKSKVYPAGDALSPAGYIYVAGADRTIGAIRAYTEGGTIRPKDGHKYLALPLPVAGKRAITPQQFEAKTGIKLQLVPAKGRRSAMLVAPGKVGGKGTYRKATAKQTATGNHATIPVFILIPLAHLTKRFTIEGTLLPFGAQLAEEFIKQVTAAVGK